MNRPRNLNIIMELERLKGEKINNVSQYNNAVQRQVNMSRNRLDILKYKNEIHNKQIIYTGIKTNCNC